MDDRHLELLADFNQAFNRGEVDRMMALMTEDCSFENTFPPPDGALYQGQTEVRRFWESFFAATTDPKIEIEEQFGEGSRLCQRWIYHWGGENPGRIRGVDVFHLSGDKIVAKLSYVKG